ncbi:MAG: formyltransferase family protein [Methanomassiliicoccales archaeon]
MAQERGVPVIIFPSDTYLPHLKERDILEWRREYGKELRKRISDYDMDLGVLAGYMLIVDPETCNRFPIINLHPALPNTYQGTWEEIVRKVVENKDQYYGSTVHLCTPELDRGAAIAFDSFPTNKVLSSSMDMEEAVKAIRAEELKREAYLLMEAIKLIVDEKVIIKDGCVTDSFGTPISPLCLSQAIDKILSQKS